MTVRNFYVAKVYGALQESLKWHFLKPECPT